MERELLGKEEFKKFFDEIIETAMSTRGESGTLMDVLEKHGLSPQLPESLAEKVMPMLKTDMLKLREIPHNCSWCPVCTICAGCGELNFAAVGAAAASAVHIID